MRVHTFGVLGYDADGVQKVARELGEQTVGLGRTLARGQAAPRSVGSGGTTTLPEDLGATLGDAQEAMASAGEVHIGGLRRGQSIGRFVMIDLLGGGGMGEVFLCYDPELDRRVAVKLLRTLRGGREGEAPARLLREARTVARLSHPNVVTVHDVAMWEGRVFLAMEYVAGPTLGAWVGEHVGDWAAIVAVFCQAGEGLAAAHRAGIVHRDFKPESGQASQVVENTSVPRLRRWYVPIMYQAKRPRQDRAARVFGERLASPRRASCEITHVCHWNRSVAKGVDAAMNVSITLESYDLAAAERQICLEALAAAGNIVDAAKLLGLTRHALKRRIVKHRIPWQRRGEQRPGLS